MPLFTVPYAAENLTVAGRSTGSLTVEWDAPAEGGLTGYTVTVEGGGKSLTQSIEKSKMTYTFVDLTAGTQHVVGVVTLAGDQRSEPLTGKYYTGM